MDVDKVEETPNEPTPCPDSPANEDSGAKTEEQDKTADVTDVSQTDANIADVNLPGTEQNNDITRPNANQQLGEVRDEMNMDFFAKRRRINMTCSIHENRELLKKAMSKLAKEDDEYGIFGRYVASVMRSLSSEQSKRKLKKKIQQLVLDITDEDDKLPESTSPDLDLYKISNDNS